MKKLRFKIMAGLLTVAMTFVVFMSLVMTTFASDKVESPVETVDKPAKVAITKELQMPEGTKTPTATFSFVFTKTRVDGDNTAAAIGKMPDLADSSKVDYDTESSKGITKDGIKTVTANSGNILENVTWPHAGEYVYLVRENQGSYVIKGAAKETLVYSQAAYYLHIFIAEDTSGKLYVKGVAAFAERDQKGAEVQEKKKVDSSVPIDKNGGNNLKFTNTYTNTRGGGEAPNKTNESFFISKEVVGEMANKSKYFSFDVTITNNPLVSTTEYKAYITTFNGTTYTKVSLGEANNQYEKDQDYVIITVGEKKTVTLKHGQYLVVMDSPYGTKFEAVEAAAPGYAPTAVVRESGVPQLLGDDDTANVPLSSGTKTVLSDGFSNAAFTNYAIVSIPTGISLDNLPFIAMVLVAITAFGVFIFSKRPRRTGRQLPDNEK